MTFVLSIGKALNRHSGEVVLGGGGSGSVTAPAGLLCLFPGKPLSLCHALLSRNKEMMLYSGTWCWWEWSMEFHPSPHSYWLSHVLGGACLLCSASCCIHWIPAVRTPAFTPVSPLRRALSDILPFYTRLGENSHSGGFSRNQMGFFSPATW